MRGLEIGPLAAPVVRKSDGPVLYVDHADAAALRRKYASDEGMQGRLDQIVDVDFVLTPGQSLTDAVRSGAPYDYVIASHLIEHIPDLVSWLAEIAGLLAPDGVLSLVIPDKRYSFDINRAPTDISQVVDAYLRRLTRPSYQQIYDFFSRAINGSVDRDAVWAGTAEYSGVVRTDCEDPDVTAFQYSQDALASDEFVDIHCHVFTPGSFLDIYEKLVRLGLVDFEVSRIFGTERNTLEFHVSLRKVAVDEGRTVARQAQLASLAVARRALQAHEEITRTPASESAKVQMSVSELEMRLIAAKRAALGTVRQGLARARRRLAR